MNSHTNETSFEYEGFSNPNGTIVPDDVFDVLMPRLADAELRILLYIIRRTFGFKKNSDDISLRQMVEGITTRDGRVLDSGTGLSKPTVARGLAGLREKRIIVATRNRSAERGNEATSYRLRFKGEVDSVADAAVDPRENGGRVPLSHQRDKGVSHGRDKGLSHQRDTQQTVLQQTDLSYSNIRKSNRSNNQETDQSPSQPISLEGRKPSEEPSLRIHHGVENVGAILTRFNERTPEATAPKKPRGRPRKFQDEVSQTILNFVSDFAREFSDKATLNQSAARIVNDYQKWGKGDFDAFVGILYQARSITKAQGGIRGSRFAYFCSVVEDLLGLKEDHAEAPVAR